MKKLLFILPLFVISLVSNAQIRVTSLPLLDTNATALTSYVNFPFIGSNVLSFTAQVNKISSTIGGTVILQGTNDNVVWYEIDTLTIADQTLNKKKFTIASTDFISYRGKFTTSGGNCWLQMTACRRPDEHK